MLGKLRPQTLPGTQPLPKSVQRVGTALSADWSRPFRARLNIGLPNAFRQPGNAGQKHQKKAIPPLFEGSKGFVPFFGFSTRHYPLSVPA